MKLIKKILRRLLIKILKNTSENEMGINYYLPTCSLMQSSLGEHVKLYPPYSISNVSIGDYSYISKNAEISHAVIGKFCSIGPNVVCGWGIHPYNGISTSPMFYSTKEQAGMTFSHEDKIEERKLIKIGNDVFIGANVTILDGVTIGDGAVIGAGAVVSKDIPPYAIAYGVPINTSKNRFDEETIKKLLNLKWWEKEELYKQVEKDFFNVDKFIFSNSHE